MAKSKKKKKKEKELKELNKFKAALYLVIVKRLLS